MSQNNIIFIPKKTFKSHMKAVLEGLTFKIFFVAKTWRVTLFRQITSWNLTLIIITNLTGLHQYSFHLSMNKWTDHPSCLQLTPWIHKLKTYLDTTRLVFRVFKIYDFLIISCQLKSHVVKSFYTNHLAQIQWLLSLNTFFYSRNLIYY